MADIFFDGPQPPIGKQWCSVCVMLAKQAVVHEHQDEVKATAMAPADAEAVRILVLHTGKTELAPAVTSAISTVAPHFGPLPVCWSHAIGLELMPGGVAPATPEQAAMLSQAVQLGNSQGKRR